MKTQLNHQIKTHNSLINDLSKKGTPGSEKLRAQKNYSSFLGNKVTNLNTTNTEINQLMQDVYFGENASPQSQQLFNNFMQTRTQATSAISNLWKMLHEATQSLIRNLR
jgi:hypothetical protein